MKRQKWLEKRKSSKDKRKTVVRINEDHLETTEILNDLCKDVRAGVQELLEHSKHNLWHAMADIEFLLDQERLTSRVKKHRKKRQEADIVITEYQPQLAGLFKLLNEEWISKYFTIEPSDSAMLDNPQEYILDKGGSVLFASYRDKIVGTCALIKMTDEQYELAKMAVSPEARGLGIGYQLGIAIIEKAKQLGSKSVYLESNTVLKPAINLYEKLGFKRTSGHYSPYNRCNIQMEFTID